MWRDGAGEEFDAVSRTFNTRKRIADGELVAGDLRRSDDGENLKVVGAFVCICGAVTPLFFRSMPSLALSWIELHKTRLPVPAQSYRSLVDKMVADSSRGLRRWLGRRAGLVVETLADGFGLAVNTDVAKL